MKFNPMETCPEGRPVHVRCHEQLPDEFLERVRKGKEIFTPGGILGGPLSSYIGWVHIHQWHDATDPGTPPPKVGSPWILLQYKNDCIVRVQWQDSNWRDATGKWYSDQFIVAWAHSPPPFRPEPTPEQPKEKPKPKEKLNNLHKLADKILEKLDEILEAAKWR